MTTLTLTHAPIVVRDGDAEVRIGGAGETFVPELTLTRWGGEASVSCRLLHDEPGDVSVIGTTVRWATPSLDVWFYPTHTRIDGDRAYEFGLELHRPLTTLRFAMATPPHVEVTRQDPLPFEHPDGACSGMNALGRERYQPAEVPGSYVGYVPWSGDYTRCGGRNYQSGKVFHLYRTWATDAVGRFTWVESRWVDGILTLTFPEDFVASAAFPVWVDPTFGYSGTAASDDNVGGARLIFKAASNPASNGTLDSITVRGRIRNDGPSGDPNHAPAIYSDVVGVPTSLLEGSNAIGSLYGSSNAEVTTAMAGTTALTSGTQYWLGTRQAGPITDYSGSGNGVDAWVTYDASGGSSNFYFLVTNNNNDWPATVTGWTAVDNEKAYIYGTFTSSGTSISPGAGSEVWQGYAPTVSVAGSDITISPGAGSEVWQGYAPAALLGVTLAMPAGSLTWQGYQPGLAFLGPGAGSLVWQGYAPTVTVAGAGVTVTPGAGAEVWQGYAPSALVAFTVTPGAGSLVWQGYDATVLAGQTPTPGAGSLVWQGAAPTLFQEHIPQMGAGAEVWQGYAPLVQVLGPFQPGAGTLAWQGYRPRVLNSGITTDGHGSLFLYRYRLPDQTS